MPGTVPGLVMRPRLFAALDAGADTPVTLIVASPGSGKTQLVASWLRRGLPGPVAWVTVERDERDAMHFWSTVIAALRLAAGGPGSRGLASLTPAPRAVSSEIVLPLAGALAELPAPITLVIDNLSQLHASEAVAGLDELIRERPQLRLILVSRRDPNLALHGLRVAGELTEIRAADLAFTVEESADLLAAAGLAISDDGVVRLHHRTEGWAAGLRLAAMAVARVADPERAAAEYSGSERTVAEYLTSEVLAAQPADVRRLLLRTSILERVNGPLANLLTGRRDGQRVLAELEEANAFVESVDVGRSWFRYHLLLGDFLSARLEREAPEDVVGLHRSAAAWHAANGSAVEAIRHAEAGEDWEHAVDLLMECWVSLFLDGERATLHLMVARLPAEVASRDAELAALAALDHLAAGHLDDAGAHRDRAETLAGSVPPERRGRLERALAVVGLALARHQGNLPTALDAALPILEPPGGELSPAAQPGGDLRAFALMNLGMVELWVGRLDDAEDHLQEALVLARRIGRPYVEVGSLAALAEVALATGNLPAAERRAREAITLAERAGWTQEPSVVGAYAALGSLLLQRGLVEEADAWLERAERLAPLVDEPEAAVSVTCRRGASLFVLGRYEESIRRFRDARRLPANWRRARHAATIAASWEARGRVRAGDLDAARAAIDGAGTARLERVEWCNAAADLHLADGRPAAGLDALAPALEGSALPCQPSVLVETWALAAVALDRMGDADGAAAALEQAIERAERRGTIGAFLTVPDVWRALARRRGGRPHARFVATVLERAESANVREPMPTLLTDRELDVLRLLPTHLSAREMASELVVSVHTVKAHMRSIYAKLGAHRRAEAVERARDMGELGGGDRTS